MAGSVLNSSSVLCAEIPHERKAWELYKKLSDVKNNDKI
jgi:hypothetical protein